MTHLIAFQITIISFDFCEPMALEGVQNSVGQDSQFLPLSHPIDEEEANVGGG